MSDTGPLEVDPAVLADENSDYESSGYDTSTQSLTSSINAYVMENGRRYHAYFGPDKNIMPNDEIEQDRLDMSHEVLLQILQGQLHKAPIENPQRILDVGTGTGIWVIDMADKYPGAEVIGVDLSPIQPGWVPPNCRFQVDDAEREWTFDSDTFDFVHIRNVSQSVSDWPKVLSEAYRCTKPGGWIELCELGAVVYSDDNTLKVDNAIRRVMELSCKGLAQIGRAPVVGSELTDHLKTAGFVDIQAHTYKQPLGPWPRDPRMKRIGAMALLTCETGFHAYGMAVLTRVLGMDSAEADKLCREGYAAVKNKNNHIYNHYYVVYGRKPQAEKL